MNLESAIKALLRAHPKSAPFMRRRKPAVIDMAAQIVVCVSAKDRGTARNMALAIREALHGARIDDPAMTLRHIATDYFLPGDRRVQARAYVRFRPAAGALPGEGNVPG